MREDVTVYVGRAADARITAQLAIADGLDAKAGILFAYTGALLIATFQLRGEGDEVWVVVALVSGVIALALLLVTLWPVTYRDPPDVPRLNDYMFRKKDPITVEQMRHEVKEAQLIAITYNDEVLKIKGRALKSALVLITLATFAVVLEGVVRNGQ